MERFSPSSPYNSYMGHLWFSLRLIVTSPFGKCLRKLRYKHTHLYLRCFDIVYWYRGYYTVARRYELFVWVARTISHEWTQRTSEKLFLPLTHKIHIFELTCNVLFTIKTYWWRRFWRRSEDFRRRSEDFPSVPKATRTLPNIFWKFPNTFEEDPKKIRSYTNEFKYNLRDKLDISEIIDIFTRVPDEVSFEF